MAFDNWDEVRTAFQVARLGTVSGAAEVLGVHHATVIRHIDSLEKRLGAKLFQRHARGYTPTEAGRDLLVVAQTTEEQFSQLSSRIKGQGETVTGELVVTAVSGMADLLSPMLTGFQEAHPGLTVRFLTDLRVFRLDYGEAHVAIRAGSAPEEPDNVVQPLARMRTGLYAAERYADAHGLPESPADFTRHRFVSADSELSRAPEPQSLFQAVVSGAGIGFISAYQAAQQPGLIEVMAPRPEWEAPLWIVTHVDLHRTLKVQSFLNALKEAARGWDGI